LLAIVYIAAASMSVEFHRRVENLKMAIGKLIGGQYEFDAEFDRHDDLSQLAQSLHSLSVTLAEDHETTHQQQPDFEALQAKLELQTPASV
jgi:signal transduction histidine kinase